MIPSDDQPFEIDPKAPPTGPPKPAPGAAGAASGFTGIGRPVGPLPLTPGGMERLGRMLGGKPPERLTPSEMDMLFGGLDRVIETYRSLDPEVVAALAEIKRKLKIILGS